MHVPLYRVLLLAFCLLIPCVTYADSEAAPLTDEELARILEIEMEPPQGEISSPEQGITYLASCSANCYGAGSASCSGSSCTAVDRNCSAGQRGYAQCGGTTHYCNTCSSGCTGSCCECLSECGSTGGKKFSGVCICC